jgi:hypothetical protein
VKQTWALLRRVYLKILFARVDHGKWDGLFAKPFS